MTRELKFRAWSTEYNRFLDCGSSQLSRYLRGYANPVHENINFKTITVQQYTGLKDKNGVDIYEGDILKILNSDRMVPDLYDEMFVKGERVIVQVERSRLGEYYGSNSVYSCYSLLDYENWEVIGNIFENPELIKTEI